MYNLNIRVWSSSRKVEMESLRRIYFHIYYNWYIFNATIDRNELYGRCDTDYSRALSRLKSP